MKDRKFIGRKKELAELESAYKSNRFEFAVIYGRRRVGKTTLIREFVRDKRAIFFTALQTEARMNLKGLSDSVAEVIPSAMQGMSFTDYDNAIDNIFKLAEKERTILIIDEYPYLAESYKTIPSLLQKKIDENKGNSKLFLILCGSSMSFMERQVLGYQSPLYGRRTAQFKISQFGFFEAKDMYSRFSKVDLAYVYGAYSGIPQYLSEVDDNLSLKENIEKDFLKENAFIYEEPTNLLKQEVRDPANYNAIINSIANGNNRNSEIANMVSLSTGLVSDFIGNLISLGIVEKETPIVKSNNKKIIYSLKDNLFKFWYKFVPDNMPLISKDMSDLAYQNIEMDLNTYMGPIFEDICIEYMWKMNKEAELPISFIDIGRWWGNNPQLKHEIEIDILAYDKKDTAIFGECKWKNKKVTSADIDDLVEKSAFFGYKKKYYYLFSKSGFDESAIRMSRDDGHIHLINYDEMFEN